MENQIESDFELAQRLQRELNEPSSEIIVLSDSDYEIVEKKPQIVKEEVCFDHQQAITV